VASRAAARGAIVQGLDFSSAMLAVARAREPSMQFDDGDAESLPYEDGSFDVVVSNFGIHHVAHPSRALQEARRVLRAGGDVAFSFWAAPTENIAWKLVFDAVERHGDRNAAQTPMPGGGFNTADQCIDALREAGFVDCATRLVRATWSHTDAAALVTALRAGTARMAAMLEAQHPEVLRAIIADIAANAERYRDVRGLAVPVAAVIATGKKR
jgi:SAM-dependent methyltransferase